MTDYQSRFVGAVIFSCALALSVGCGGGGEGGSTPPAVAPSNLVYPQSSITATVVTSLTPIVPTVTGTVTSYAISPALRSGLSLDAGTGAISGTPTTAAASSSYTITAANSEGSTTAVLQITVNLAPPSNLTYPHSSISASTGTAISTITPTVTGTVTAYSEERQDFHRWKIVYGNSKMNLQKKSGDSNVFGNSPFLTSRLLTIATPSFD